MKKRILLNPRMPVAPTFRTSVPDGYSSGGSVSGNGVVLGRVVGIDAGELEAGAVFDAVPCPRSCRAPRWYGCTESSGIAGSCTAGKRLAMGSPDSLLSGLRSNIQLLVHALLFQKATANHQPHGFSLQWRELPDLRVRELGVGCHFVTPIAKLSGPPFHSASPSINQDSSSA